MGKKFMIQQDLFPNEPEDKDKNKFKLNHHVYLRIQNDSPKVSLIVGGMLVKQANLKDRVEKKLFIIDAIALAVFVKQVVA